MLISIASLRQPTYKSQFSKQRPSYLSISEYLRSELDARVDHVLWKIKDAAKAAQERHVGAECLFFTLPEFFWNVPWHVVRSEDELHELSSAYLEQVSSSVVSLMKALPIEQFGEIVLLGGSCATLIKVEEGGSSYYDVINYLLAVSNKEHAGDAPVMTMWPKRNVSSIDFGEHVGASTGYWYFSLFDDVVIKVKDLSNVQAEYSSAGGYEGKFLNNLVPGCPFGVNLCLDYDAVKAGERDEEMKLTEARIDFLIACGMTFDHRKKHPMSLQYAIRNDGFGDGQCEVVKLEHGRIAGVVPSEVIDGSVHLASIQIA